MGQHVGAPSITAEIAITDPGQHVGSPSSSAWVSPDQSGSARWRRPQNGLHLAVAFLGQHVGTAPSTARVSAASSP